MPTVDQLAAAAAVSDSDEIALSQSGVLRRATRAQLLFGTQPQLLLGTGALLGRQSGGEGPPESITIGLGLKLTAGVLQANTPQVSLSGLDASTAVVRPSGTTVPNTLASLLADTVSPESFGAVGDGVTDDTAAIAAAIATQRTVRLGPRVYATSGQWTIGIAANLVGTPGLSIIRRISQLSGGAWISIQGPSFHAYGVIFDANNVVASSETWAVLVTASCLQADFRVCTFSNAAGPTLGNGLTVLASDPAVVAHAVDSCVALGNSAHGIWFQAVDGVRITNNRTHDNLAYGICVDYEDPRLRQAVRLALISNNVSWNNSRGISVGNFNETNLQPPTWGNANPDAIAVIVGNNLCYNNKIYGIAVSGRSLIVHANLCSANGSTANGGGGILANCAYSKISANVVTGAGQFGVDSGGSINLDLSGNHITGATIGINSGGSQDVRVTSNMLQDNGWAVVIYNVETDGAGKNFGISTSNIVIANNTIAMSAPSGGGVYLIDAPQNILVTDNNFVGANGATIGQCLYAHTDSIIIERNRWNATQRLFANPSLINGLQTVQLPDIADDVMLSNAPFGVQSIQTLHQLAVKGQIGFVKVTAGGMNYTHATINITGKGVGATATALISNGSIIGVALVNPGAGYDTNGGVASATIVGDGQGAAALVSVGLPLVENRRVRIACNVAIRFARIGSWPFQENWTLSDVTVPANATVTYVATFGAWRAEVIPLADYIAPPGDGSLLLRTMPGSDLTLRPATTGHVRVSTDADPQGYIVATGHGSPNGVITAPPGSDYRNLDGGPGETLWIKQVGADAKGWFAIA